MSRGEKLDLGEQLLQRPKEERHISEPEQPARRLGLGGDRRGWRHGHHPGEGGAGGTVQTGGAGACRLQELWGAVEVHREACLGRSPVGSGS